MINKGKPKSLFGGFSFFGGVSRLSAKGVNLTPGKAVRAANGDMVLPGEQWTATNGDTYQNQDGELKLIAVYDPKNRDFGHQNR